MFDGQHHAEGRAAIQLRAEFQRAAVLLQNARGELLDEAALAAARMGCATLLLSQPDRLRELLLSADRPVQFVFAGKAHPADQPGKDMIRGIYLNYVYLGGNAAGVEAASRRYFDKGVKDITIAEAAMLAGIVGTIVALLALWRLDRLDGHRARRRIPVRWRTFTAVDATVIAVSVFVPVQAAGSATPSRHTLNWIVEPTARSRTHCLPVPTVCAPVTDRNVVTVPFTLRISWTVPEFDWSCSP